MVSTAAAKQILSWLLIVVGSGLMVAFAFAVLPKPLLAAVHDWLGLGLFPDQPVAEYLARSTSLLYGVHGFVMFAVGRNLEKYLELARLIGWLHVAIGLAMFAIDLISGMPWWWTAFEGIPVAITGGIVVWLQTIATPK